MNQVQPKTFLIGYTTANDEGIYAYLHHTNQLEFLETWKDATRSGVIAGEVICSFYAKLCYKALTETKNQNISKTRNISENIAATLAAGHGSVFEHVWLNFVTTNCSRVFTHELVRHRVGTAFSQTSGRYVRSDQLDMVLNDPILDILTRGNLSIRSHLVDIAVDIEQAYQDINASIDWSKIDFAQKKKLTSALRRILLNGQANEIGWSANVRTLRHLIMLRTARFAEFEIRSVFSEVYHLCLRKWPLLFADAKVEIVDGLPEITGMKTQPY